LTGDVQALLRFAMPGFHRMILGCSLSLVGLGGRFVTAASLRARTLMCSIAMALALASRSGTAANSLTQQLNM